MVTVVVVVIPLVVAVAVALVVVAVLISREIPLHAFPRRELHERSLRSHSVGWRAVNMGWGVGLEDIFM